MQSRLVRKETHLPFDCQVQLVNLGCRMTAFNKAIMVLLKMYNTLQRGGVTKLLVARVLLQLKLTRDLVLTSQKLVLTVKVDGIDHKVPSSIVPSINHYL